MCVHECVRVCMRVCVCVCMGVCALLQLEIVIEDLCSLCFQNLHASGLCDIICRTNLSIYPTHTKCWGCMIMTLAICEKRYHALLALPTC